MKPGWNWMAGSSPAMTAERAVNFFTRSCAGMTLRVYRGPKQRLGGRIGAYVARYTTLAPLTLPLSPRERGRLLNGHSLLPLPWKRVGVRGARVVRFADAWKRQGGSGHARAGKALGGYGRVKGAFILPTAPLWLMPAW
jgi:hypothetical protein